MVISHNKAYANQGVVRAYLKSPKAEHPHPLMQDRPKSKERARVSHSPATGG